jgi:tetratricopeptide (TPR) repeat protein
MLSPMKPLKTSRVKKNTQGGYLFAAYYLVISLFFLATFFPEARVWGVNWWAYLPVVIKYSLLLIGIVALPAVSYWSRKLKRGDSSVQGSDQKFTDYLLPVFLTIVLFSLFFVIFRGSTHFLGDGYQLLARLADRVPSMKAWDYGTSLIQDGLFSLLSGPHEARALLTFQILSVVSGIGLLIGVALVTRALYNHNLQRFLFFLGLASGGYMLMFFGYVENYSLFVAGVMLYALVGLAVFRKKVSRWWVLPLLVLTLFLHLFGVTLLPSLFYLMLRDSRLGRWLGNISLKTKLLIAAALVVLLFLSYYYLRANYYFFTFALLPIVPDRFTVENDTLFSLKHIADISNLLMLLVPGLPVFLTMFLMSPAKGLLNRAEYRFLLILVLSTLGAVYVFNPGIGMPRNWDLFSLAGVPLAVLCFYYALERGGRTKSLLLRAIPVIVLGFLSLAPRVATQVVPKLGIAHFKNYLVLDKIRNRNAHGLLTDYYEQVGDFAATQKERERIEVDFPEIEHFRTSAELMKETRFAEAAVYLRKALKRNPLFYNVYANLGACYLYMGNLDSALVMLRIADGVNPYNPKVTNNLGTIYLRQGELVRAEKYFLKSLRIDSTGQNAMVGLASVYLQMNEFDRSLECIGRIFRITKYTSGGAPFSSVTYDYFRQAGDAFRERQAFDQAAVAYQYAIDRGLDSAYVDGLKEKFPQLKR